MSAKLCTLLFSLKIPMLTIKLATTTQSRASGAGKRVNDTQPLQSGASMGVGGVADRTVELVTSDEI